MRTMTKERKKEGPRLGHKGRADAKASRQLLLLCIPAIIGYILFNYIPMGAAVIIPFKNYKFSKGILGSDWCGLANFKWIIQSVALDRALRNTVLYGLLFMVLSPVTKFQHKGCYPDGIQPRANVISLIVRPAAVSAARTHDNCRLCGVTVIWRKIRFKRILYAAVRHGLVP